MHTPSRRVFLAACAAAILPTPLRAAPSARVVIAGGDLTEIAFALGAGADVVGADSTSIWPPETERLARIGYMRRLSAEGVLSLAPDLVIWASDAGPPAVIAQLRAAGLAVAVAPEGKTVASVPAKIGFMGAALGRAAEARALIAAFDAQMRALDLSLRPVTARPSVLFVLSAGRGAPLVAGQDTAADAVIALARGRNAAGAHSGYKPLSAEIAIAAAPDFILAPAHAAAFLGGRDAILSRPEIAATPAGRAGRLVVMDGLKLLGFGPRTPDAAAELALALHPELAR
jgi:iron complex transport system substrate-binding protein